jgi:hypothetical protein
MAIKIAWKEEECNFVNHADYVGCCEAGGISFMYRKENNKYFFHVIFQDIRYVKMWGGGNGWTICIIILQSSKSKKRGAKAEK